MTILPWMSSCLLALAALSLPLASHAGQAKPSPGPNACQVLPSADVARVTASSHVSAEPIGSGYGCGYGEAQLLIYSGDKAEERWEQTMKNFGHGKAERRPIAGVGEKAYSFYPKPRDKYEDTNAFVVVRQGPYVIAMSVAAPAGKTAESVQPQALELARLVLGRLQ